MASKKKLTGLKYLLPISFENNIKNFWKNCEYCRKMKKVVILKSSKTFYYILKLWNNLLSNSGGGPLALEASETQKKSRKLETK